MAEPVARSDDGPAVVVGIGASAGGVEALRKLVGRLPADLNAAVCIVLHLPASGKSLLAPILDRASPLPSAVAVDGEPLVAGRLYVAPADFHLLVHDGRIALTRGPKENGTRPAVDPMLRTLAQHYGPRAVAVVLSGALGDGSAGAAAVAAAGGTVLVQDPADAIVPSMPESALHAVGSNARVLTGSAIGQALSEIVDARISSEEDVLMLPDPPPAELPANRLPSVERPAERPAGPPTSLTCPECGGPLWDSPHGDMPGYRCRVGHVYSEDALVAGQADMVEAALWTAVEVLEERAELLTRVARRRGDLPRSRSRLEKGAAEALQRAALIRRALAMAPGTEAQAAGGRE